MNEYERYMFEVNGFLVIEDFLTPEQVRLINEAIDNNGNKVLIRDKSRSLAAGASALVGSHGRGDFDGFLNWPKPWCQPFRDLLSEPRIVRYMLELIGEGFRYDYASGISMTAGSEGFLLHGGRCNPGSLSSYRFQDGRMRNGLMTVSYQLVDTHLGDGGFACIPGSHKANYVCPEEMKRLDCGQDHIRHVPVKAGSVIIFTEALVHGTLPWTAEYERRILLYRYSVGALCFRKTPVPDDYASFEQELTPLQRAIMEPPYQVNRPQIQALLEEEEKQLQTVG